MPVLVGFLVLPFGPSMIIHDMNIGVLLIFAFSTFTVLAILAGRMGFEQQVCSAGLDPLRGAERGL